MEYILLIYAYIFIVINIEYSDISVNISNVKYSLVFPLHKNAHMHTHMNNIYKIIPGTTAEK